MSPRACYALGAVLLVLGLVVIQSEPTETRTIERHRKTRVSHSWPVVEGILLIGAGAACVKIGRSKRE